MVQANMMPKDVILPFNQRIERFGTLNGLKKCISTDRKIRRLELLGCPYFFWKQNEGVYGVKARFKDKKTGEIVDTTEDPIDSPKYTVGSQFFVKIMKIGNIHTLFRMATEIDSKLPRKWKNNVTYKRRDNEKKLNQIIKSIWDKSRKKKVIAHFVEDVFSSKGEIRGWVTSDYKYKSDIWVIEKQEKIIAKLPENEKLEFINGYATPTITVMNWGNPNPHIIGGLPIIAGKSVCNSEFGDAGIQLRALVYIPDHETYLTGVTTHLKTSIPHKGDVENKLKLRDLLIMEKSDVLLDLFNNISEREFAIEIDAVEIIEDDDGNDKEIQLLQQYLGIKSNDAMQKLFDIHTMEGYQNTITGTVHTIMDFATNHAQTERQRNSWQSAAIKVLSNPDEFFTQMGRAITREDAIELD